MKQKKHKSNWKPRFQLLVILVFISQNIFSQIQDFGLWTNVDIEKHFNQSFAISLSNSFRFNENISQLGQINNDIGLTYKFNKNYRLSLNYCLIHERSKDASYIQQHRFYIDFVARKKISPFVVNFRLRFQQHFDDIYEFENYSAEYFLRPKLTLKYSKFIKFVPYVYYETYIALFSNENKILKKHRLAIGCEYEFNLQHSIEAYAMLKRRFSKRLIYDDYIIGVGYKFSF